MEGLSLQFRTRVFLLLSFVCCFGRTSAQVPAQPLHDPKSENEIVLWRDLTSPETSAVPPELKTAAAKIGYTIRLQSIPREQFPELLFKAVETHQEPDLIFFTSHSLMTGEKTAKGDLPGIESNAEVRQSLIEVTELLDGRFSVGTRWSGWQYLLSTSKHYEAARRLAMRTPACVGLPVSAMVPEDLARTAEQISTAYLEHASLNNDEDAERLKTRGTRREAVQVDETKTCSAWGNDRLSFLSLISTYHSPTTVGHIHVLVVLRRSNTDWRLLAISTDPVSNSAFLDQLAANANAFQLRESTASNAQPATLVSPADTQFPQPSHGERFGEFVWLPSPEPGVVAEVAEFSYQNEPRLFLRIPSQKKDQAAVSAGSLFTTTTQWSWRIWSITDQGDVVFSTTHTFWH